MQRGFACHFSGAVRLRGRRVGHVLCGVRVASGRVRRSARWFHVVLCPFSGWCWVAPVCECPDLGRTRDCWRIAGVSAQEGSEGGWPCYSAASEWWALVPRPRGSLAFVRVCIALAGVCFFRVAPQWPSIIVARGRARAWGRVSRRHLPSRSRVCREFAGVQAV